MAAEAAQRALAQAGAARLLQPLGRRHTRMLEEHRQRMLERAPLRSRRRQAQRRLGAAVRGPGSPYLDTAVRKLGPGQQDAAVRGLRQRRLDAAVLEELLAQPARRAALRPPIRPRAS